jgi:hypothetical protein
MAEEKKKSFATYVAEVKTEYKYVLKFAVNEMTDDMVDTLEASLKKYDLKKASSFRKTPIQESPLDFPNIKNTAVFICDLTLGYPGSLDFLRTYVCNNLGISPSQLAVYSENDPRQIETDLYLDRNSPEYKKSYKARLGSEPDDAEDVPYGAAYNTEFLKALDKVTKERNITIVTNALSPAASTDHSTLTKNYDSFNDPKNLKKDDLGLFGRVKKPSLSRAGVV